jgi:hypothetical protein
MNKAQARRMAFTENKEGLTFRGKGLRKERWYSICSAHGDHDKDCPRCQVGHWHNVFTIKISGWFHDHCYPLWYFWVNNI